MECGAGLLLASLYWHFVDVVWLCVFSVMIVFQVGSCIGPRWDGED